MRNICNKVKVILQKSCNEVRAIIRANVPVYVCKTRRPFRSNNKEGNELQY